MANCEVSQCGGLFVETLPTVISGTSGRHYATGSRNKKRAPGAHAFLHQRCACSGAGQQLDHRRGRDAGADPHVVDDPAKHRMTNHCTTPASYPPSTPSLGTPTASSDRPAPRVRDERHRRAPLATTVGHGRQLGPGAVLRVRVDVGHQLRQRGIFDLPIDEIFFTGNSGDNSLNGGKNALYLSLQPRL